MAIQKAIKTIYADGSVVWSNLRNKKGVPVIPINATYTATKVTTWYDGSPMTEEKADGLVYFKEKESNDFYLVNLPNWGENYLEKDTAQSFRDMNPTEILLIRAGYYKGVKLNGYHQSGDTPYSINYHLSSTTNGDDGGGVFYIGLYKFEHKFIGIVHPEHFGAKGNGLNDDTTALNRCLNIGIKVQLENRYRITDTLLISKPIEVAGIGKNKTYIIPTDNTKDGILVTTAGVKLTGFTLALSVRHTVTPNTVVGIKALHPTNADLYNHIYDNIGVDGFQRAFVVTNIWNALFSDVTVNFCKKGIEFDGKSVNNTINNNTNIHVSGVDSIGIDLNGRVASEGLFVDNTIVFGAETAIRCRAFSHLYVTNSFLDFCTKYGVLVVDNGVSGSFNQKIEGTYIAMSGSYGSAAIYMANNIGHPESNRADKIVKNDILVYSGSSCVYGIYVEGSAHDRPIIDGNTLKGFSIYDIRTRIGSNPLIINNDCLSAISPNIEATGTSMNNKGTVSFDSHSSNYIRMGNKKIGFNTSISDIVHSEWTRGDIIFNLTPNNNGNVGWVKVAEPSTWSPFGNINLDNATTSIKGLVNQASASADTATQASGATPTKAEFDALLAELRDLKTKMRAGSAPILAPNTP